MYERMHHNITGNEAIPCKCFNSLPGEEMKLGLPQRTRKVDMELADLMALGVAI